MLLVKETGAGEHSVNADNMLALQKQNLETCIFFFSENIF